MVFENSDSDEDNNVKINITRKSNKRKRNEVETKEEISDKDKYIELNILYNLYGFLSDIIRDNNMSVISFKKFIDEFLDELQQSDTKKNIILMEDIMKKIDYTYRPTKRSRKKYEHIMNQVVEICRNGLKDFISVIKKKNYI